MSMLIGGKGEHRKAALPPFQKSRGSKDEHARSAGKRLVNAVEGGRRLTEIKNHSHTSKWTPRRGIT